MSEKLVDHRCVECNKVAGKIKPGSQIAKGAKLVCAGCQENWKLLKKSAEMFRKLAKEGAGAFGGLGDVSSKNIFNGK